MPEGRATDGKRGGTPETRERILRAATELFAAQGYGGTTIRQVAERAGASSMLIYYYFGSKEQLLEAAIGEPAGRVRAMLERAVESEGPVRGRVERFVREYVAFVLAHGAVAGIMFRALVSGERELADRIRLRVSANAELLRRLIEEGVRGGEFRPLDARLAAGSLFGMLVFYVIAGPVVLPALGLAPGPDFGDALADHTIELFLRGVRADGGEA